MQSKLLLILLLALLIQQADAQSLTVTVDSSSCTGSLDLLTTLTNLPSCITETFFSTLITGFVYSINQFLENSITFISATPDIHNFCSPYSNVMGLVESLYTLAIMGLGLYYLISSTDVEARIRAKSLLKNLFFMILALSLAYYVFDIMLSLNTYITTSFLSQSTYSVFNPTVAFTSLVFAFVLLITMTAVLMLTFSTILLRYIMIPFMLLLFPIAIFLYFIPFTQSWGKAFLRLIIVTVFMTSADALLILALSTLFGSGDPNLATPFVQAMGIIMGFSMIGVLNALLLIMASFSIIGQTTKILGPLPWVVIGALTRLL